jgi:hypothetical protein
LSDFVHGIKQKETQGLRIARWDTTFTAYNYAAFRQHYGDDAVDFWNQAEKVTDLECNWLVCWVQLGEEKRKCSVAKLRSCGSTPIKTLLELCHRSPAELECFIDPV